MRIDIDRLESVASNESEAEQRMATDMVENRDLYKASFRIAMKIKRCLRMKGMTQTQLADVMGVDSAVVCRYLSGKANMELKTIVKIEKALGLSIIDRGIAPKMQKVIVLKDAFSSSERITSAEAPKYCRVNRCLHAYSNKEYRVETDLNDDKWGVAEPVAKYGF